MTGMHHVADIFCNGCQTTIGWKYVCIIILFSLLFLLLLLLKESVDWKYYSIGTSFPDSGKKSSYTREVAIYCKSKRVE